jgi:DNA-binding GntR family transcriptional regulator
MVQCTLTPRRLETYELVRQLILGGEIPADSRIVESTLCEQLGVSRTPMREALFRLEQEGLVKQDLARGFSVLPLSAREVRETYPIIWTLEILALESAEGRFEFERLKELNKSLLKATTPELQHAIDDEWHQLLISGCRNTRLLKNIEVLKNSAHRYELAFMRHCGTIDTSIAQHKEILQFLEQKNIKKASKALEDNWRSGMNALLDWLDWKDN